jgi:hypothetical protein
VPRSIPCKWDSARDIPGVSTAWRAGAGIRARELIARLMRARSQIKARCAIAAAAAVAFGAAVPLDSGAAPSTDQLRSGIDRQRSREQTLTSSIQSLSALIGRLQGDIALVQSRQADLGVQLVRDRVALAAAQTSLARERKRVTLLVRRLARARVTLAHQLVGAYETDSPDLVTVVLSAHGFADLLERLDFLRIARRAQQSVVVTTKNAKQAAQSAARQLSALEASDQQVTAAVAARTRAVAAMNTLLQSRRATLRRARAIQVASLRATQSRRRQLEGSLAALIRQQQQQQQLSASAPSGAGGSLGQWAIPSAIVMCESGGQNLPPNSAGASGYYQIIPSTWSTAGGHGPAAYLAPKAEQDRVAGALWDGGRGASNWVCAGLVR